MIKSFLFSFIIFFTSNISVGQDNNRYSVDEFYKKVELDNGTLDESGQSIDFIFVKVDLDQGKYEIEISDGPGDLYEIKGTDSYIKFSGYYGYAGYGEEGYLYVGSSTYSSYFYKKED